MTQLDITPLLGERSSSPVTSLVVSTSPREEDTSFNPLVEYKRIGHCKFDHVRINPMMQQLDMKCGNVACLEIIYPVVCDCVVKVVRKLQIQVKMSDNVTGSVVDRDVVTINYGSD